MYVNCECIYTTIMSVSYWYKAYFNIHVILLTVDNNLSYDAVHFALNYLS